jgi:hypothetical protein
MPSTFRAAVSDALTGLSPAQSVNKWEHKKDAK